MKNNVHTTYHHCKKPEGIQRIIYNRIASIEQRLTKKARFDIVVSMKNRSKFEKPCAEVGIRISIPGQKELFAKNHPSEMDEPGVFTALEEAFDSLEYLIERRIKATAHRHTRWLKLAPSFDY